MLDIDNIPLDDDKVYAMLCHGDVHGVFQLDSYGGKKLTVAMQPHNLMDIAVITSLDRPGPLEAGMDNVYMDRRHGRKPVTYLHPLLEPILKDTLGVIIFQEQTMQIARDIAGYTLGESDLIREAVGHKLPELMRAQRHKFVAGATLTIGDKMAAKLWEQIVTFSGYGFNKPHAIGYALMAYQCAWLKCHYPAEFYAALMNDRLDDTVKLQESQRAARRAGVKLLRPDMYESTDRWVVVETDIDSKALRPSLTGIRDFGGVAYNALQTAIAKARTFRSLHHLLSSANQGKLNSKAMEALIRSGACFDLGEPGELLRALPETIAAIRKEREDKQKAYYLSKGLRVDGKPRVRPLKVT